MSHQPVDAVVGLVAVQAEAAGEVPQSAHPLLHRRTLDNIEERLRWRRLSTHEEVDVQWHPSGTHVPRPALARNCPIGDKHVGDRLVASKPSFTCGGIQAIDNVVNVSSVHNGVCRLIPGVLELREDAAALDVPAQLVDEAQILIEGLAITMHPQLSGCPHQRIQFRRMWVVALALAHRDDRGRSHELPQEAAERATSAVCHVVQAFRGCGSANVGMRISPSLLPSARFALLLLRLCGRSGRHRRLSTGRLSGSVAVLRRRA